jgi:deazaflavin-dependent oxidoreductase (nitroreductase family)
MAESNFFLRSGNIMFSWLLRSSLHGLLSKNFVLVSVTGRKSGKVYTTPVNYRRAGEALQVISTRERTWWRNLRGEGAAATLHLQGKDVQTWGQVLEDEQEVAQMLVDYLMQVPQVARYFGVKPGPDGKLSEDEIRQAAKDKVIVEFRQRPPAV